MAESPLRDESEAAAFLRRPVRTLQHWRYAGGGPRFVKQGRRVFYLQSDLEAFLETNRRSSTSDTGGGKAA